MNLLLGILLKEKKYKFNYIDIHVNTNKKECCFKLNEMIN